MISPATVINAPTLATGDEFPINSWRNFREHYSYFPEGERIKRSGLKALSPAPQSFGAEKRTEGARIAVRRSLLEVTLTCVPEYISELCTPYTNTPTLTVTAVAS